MDIKEEIIKYLNSIKNQFNEVIIESRIENIDSSVKRFQKFISNIDSEKYSLNDLFNIFFDSIKAEVVFESGNIALFKKPGLWSIKRKYRHGRWVEILDLLRSKHSKEEAILEAKKIVDVYGRGYTKIDKLDVPSGQLIFANFFLNIEGEYAFCVPKELKYEEKFSINNKFGRQNCMNLLAKTHNLGYTQLGNTTAEVFKVNDDQLFICPRWYFDEEDKDVLPPKNWQSLGTICCEVWRIEFIDEKYLKDKKDLNTKLLEENDKVTVQVNPGSWTVHNYYHDTSDKTLAKKFGFPVWVELNRIKY